MNNANENARILIVDDTIQNIQVLGTILKEANYQINVAQDGQQALDSIEKVLPDLILLDIMMPVMDGFETCTRLKADEKTQDIPIIFLTAKVEAEDIVRGFELGAVDYVTKPFNAAELFVRVESHLTRRRLQIEVERQLAEIAHLKEEQEFFVNHELHNRVEPTANALEQFIRAGIPALTEGQQALLQRAAEGIDGLSDLVRVLQKLQDFGRGDYDLSKTTVQLDQLLRRTITDLETTFGELANVNYQNQLTDPTIAADRDLLTGMFSGLLKESIERVAGHEDAAARTVQIVLSEQNGRVTAEVKTGGAAATDDGMAELMAELGTDGQEEKQPDRAMGYAYLVARAHGGELEVDSSSGEGTTVRITLSR